MFVTRFTGQHFGDSGKILKMMYLGGQPQIFLGPEWLKNPSILYEWIPNLTFTDSTVTVVRQGPDDINSVMLKEKFWTPRLWTRKLIFLGPNFASKSPRSAVAPFPLPFFDISLAEKCRK